MAYNMAWFRKKWEAERKQQEEAKNKADGPEYDIKNEKEHVRVYGDDKIDGTGYYKFHKNTNYLENPHYFLGEELLIPYASSTDTQRARYICSR